MIAVARTSKAMLNSSGESGHPCLDPDFKGNVFSFSPLKIMFAVDLSYMVFIIFLVCLLSGGFFKKNHKWVFNFIKGIICSFWNNCMVFIFQFVNMVSHIVWFVNIEESLHPWDKAHLVMMYGLFNMLLDSVFLEFFLRIFASMSLVILGRSFLFLWHLCQVLVLG